MFLDPTLYESVFNSAPIGNYLLSPTPEAVILAVNDAFLLASSRTREELVGRSLFEAFPGNPDDPGDTGEPVLRRSLAKVAATGRGDTLPAQRYPIAVTGADGQVRYEERFWNAVSTPIFDAAGTLVCISHQTIDVTPQIQAERALRESERAAMAAAHQAEDERKRLEAVLQSVPVGIVVSDAEGGVLLSNAAHRALWGGNPPEPGNVEGFRAYRGWWADGSARHGQPLAPQDWTTARILRGEEALRDVIEIERFGPTPSRRICLNSGAPIRAQDGSIAGAVVAQLDITDRIRIEHDLADSREQFRKIVSQAATGVLQADARGRITLVNQKFCDLLGRREQELIGVDIAAITAPGWVEPTLGVLRALREGRQETVLEMQYLRSDGSAMWATSSINALRSHDGGYLGFVAVVVDITARKQAEEALKEADRRKDEFLAMLAHELRNPLAPIAAAADLIGHGRLDAERLRHTSEIIGRQVRHMTGLVDDLLDVSRVTRGLVRLDKAALDVSEVVAEAVEQVRPLMEARRHRLRVVLPDEPMPVLGDRKRLVQVLTNLLNNAAKYTPEGGAVEVGLAREGEQVVLEVEDNGIGMAPELVARAFELFAQATRSADRAQGGLGIGLALVKNLVELHGGRITAQSAGPGQGSRFTVRLPRHAGAAPDGRERDGLGAAGQRARPLKVLVVDDNVDAAQTLALLVEACGHEVRVEHASGAALASAAARPPDVCLLDIGLPDIDGNELARRLRAAPATRHALLVAVTGYGQEQDRLRAQRAGFDHHFVKPVDVTRLVALLDQVAAEGARVEASPDPGRPAGGPG